jgi:hypothetical protein
MVTASSSRAPTLNNKNKINNEPNKKNNNFYIYFIVLFLISIYILIRINSNNNSIDIFGLKKFFSTDLYFFMKYYFYFIILFSLCFYILLYVNNRTKDAIILTESKIFLYITIIFLFIIINDIMQTPLESLQKFLLIIIITLTIIYIVNYLIVYYYKKNLRKFKNKLLLIIPTTIIIYLLSVLCIYYTFHKNNEKVAIELYYGFNYGVSKNLNFLIFLTLYIYFFCKTYKFFDLKSSITDIINPVILGSILLFFIFILIIYFAIKQKIISKNQILNSMISLISIFVFLISVGTYIFMSSLSTICTENVDKNAYEKNELVIILTVISIFCILWLVDSRQWHRIGSIIFIFSSIFILYVFFYYSMYHPSLSLFGLWGFIEVLIIYFYRKENTKNSIHFSLMQT